MSEQSPEQSPRTFVLTGTELVDYLNNWADALNVERDYMQAEVKARPSLIHDEAFMKQWRQNEGKIELLNNMGEDLSSHSIHADMEQMLHRLLEDDDPQSA